MTDDERPLDPSRIPRPLAYPLEQRREGVLEKLQKAFVDGLLTSEEFEERMELAGTALNDAELAVLVDDLPGAGGDMAKAPSTALVPTGTQPMVPTSSAGSKESANLIAILGESKRQGAWHVPPVVKVIAILGSARVDLTEAHLPPVTEIQCSAILSEIRIDVPPSVRVESAGAAVLGEFSSKEQAPGNPDAPLVRVTGFALLGSVEIRVKK